MKTFTLYPNKRVENEIHPGYLHKNPFERVFVDPTLNHRISYVSITRYVKDGSSYFWLMPQAMMSDSLDEFMPDKSMTLLHTQIPVETNGIVLSHARDIPNEQLILLLDGQFIRVLGDDTTYTWNAATQELTDSTT